MASIDSSARELPGERASFRMGSVVNVALVAFVLVGVIVVGLVLDPLALAAAPVLLLVELHFIRVALRAWHSDPVPRIELVDEVPDLVRAVAAEALTGPVSTRWMADWLRPVVRDESERRELVLQSVAYLLRSGAALAGRIPATGPPTACAEEEALDRIRAFGEADPEPVWLALTGPGRDQVESWVGAGGDADARPPLTVGLELGGLPDRDGEPSGAGAWAAAVADAGADIAAAADGRSSPLRVHLEFLVPGDVLDSPPAGTRVQIGIRSLDLVVVEIALDGSAPVDTRAHVLGAVRAGLVVAEEWGFSHGVIDEPLDELRAIVDAVEQLG